MIIVTGGAGFIGSAFVWRLNQEGHDDILIVDVLDASDKWKNLVNLRFADYMDRDDFLRRLEAGTLPPEVEALVHMGACSSTTERDARYLMENNTHFTQRLTEWALDRGLRFVYASSGATYGDGQSGYADEDDNTLRLKPLNMYGYSKHRFDLWSLRNGYSTQIAGVKFFNVFGPNEYHKGEMRSMVHKAFEQIRDTGRVRLFRSHHPDYRDGEQLRDFVYVKDAVEVLWWLVGHPESNGLFNVGTGRARTWNDLARSVFAALGKEPAIDYIDMPEVLRNRYHYHTQADVTRLRAAGYGQPWSELEDAVSDYVRHYLLQDDPHLG